MTRSETKAANRAAIISAAAALFKERGYGNSTMRDIARAAKLSTGAIFANFTGKDEVWEAVYGFAPVEANKLLAEAVQILTRYHEWGAVGQPAGVSADVAAFLSRPAVAMFKAAAHG